MRLGMTSPRRPGWREQVRQLAATPNSSRLHAKLLGEGLSQCSEPCKAKQGGKTKCHAMLTDRASPAGPWRSPKRKARIERGMARVTGLEPATSGVTGRHSNQLSYTPVRRHAG